MVAGLRDFEQGSYSPREKLALRFAELMALDHHRVDDQFFEGLRQQFTDPEIFELGMITGQVIGYGRLIQCWTWRIRLSRGIKPSSPAPVLQGEGWLEAGVRAIGGKNDDSHRK